MRRTWRVHPLVQSVTRVRAVLHQIVPISFLGADGRAGFGRGGGPGVGPGGLGMLCIDMPIRSFTSASVLLIANLFHPIDDLSHQSPLNGNVRHRFGRSCAVPMFLTR